MRCTHSHTQWHSATLLSAASLSREIARAPVYTFTYLSIYILFVCGVYIYLIYGFRARDGVGERRARDDSARGSRVRAASRDAGESLSPLPARRGRGPRGQSCFVYKYCN